MGAEGGLAGLACSHSRTSPDPPDTYAGAPTTDALWPSPAHTSISSTTRFVS